ncbi:MAG: sel1 repeat family protein [Ignavibacteriales bacterium]|nr:sel1 repeat family protein [Ignavibacteriales bacterium]
MHSVKPSITVILLLSGLLFNIAEAQRKTAPAPSSVQSMIKQSNLDYQLREGFELVQKANGGDAAAQHELGLRYLMGTGFLQDTLKGAYWIQKSAGQDFLLARYNLGILLLNGVGVGWNPFEAYKNFKHAAGRNMSDAQYVQGLLLTEDLIVPRDWSRAYVLIKQAAENNFEPAKKVFHEFEKRGIQGDTLQEKKGRRSPGDSTARKFRPIFLDFDIDTSWQANDSTLVGDVFREASPSLKAVIDTSYHRAFTSSIVLSENKNSQVNNRSVVFTALENEAEGGSPEALTLLGRLYERGVDVERDPFKAASYYLRALRLESPRAYEFLWNVTNEKSFAEGLDRKSKAGDPEARVVWAGLVAAQIERRLSGEQAVHLLESAAESGNTEAMIELGMCYQSGRWVKQDRAKSEDHFEKAVRRGNREARLRLATLAIARGEHLGSNLEILRRAYEEGSILAQVGLGYCHEKGIGMAQNRGEASRLYRDASKRGSDNAYQALRRMHDDIRPKEPEFEMME